MSTGRPYRKRLEYFGGNTSCHGIKSVITSEWMNDTTRNPIGRRSVWMTLVGFSLGALLYMTIAKVILYISAEVSTSVSYAYDYEQSLPVIALCSLNPFKYNNDDGFTMASEGVYTTVNSSTGGYLLSDIVDSVTLLPENTVLSSPDNYTITSFVDQTRGRCYGLNFASIASRMPGSNYGLRILLNDDVNEHLTDTRMSGWVVKIMRPHQVASPRMHDAMIVGTGMGVNLAIRRETLTRQPAPFSDCVCSVSDMAGDTKFELGARATCPTPDDETLTADSYSVDQCINDCVNTKILALCNCTPGFVEGSENNCVQDTEYFTCYSSNIAALTDSCSQGGRCPERCFEDSYAVEYFTSNFPTKYNSLVLTLAQSKCIDEFAEKIYTVELFLFSYASYTAVTDLSDDMDTCEWEYTAPNGVVDDDFLVGFDVIEPNSQILYECGADVTADNISSFAKKLQNDLSTDYTQLRDNSDASDYVEVIEALIYLYKAMQTVEHTDSLTDTILHTCGQIPLENKPWYYEPYTSYIDKAKFEIQEIKGEITIYFENFNLRDESAVPNYIDAFALLSDLGGTWGIFAGISFITIFEFFEFVVFFFLFRNDRRVCSMKTNDDDVPEEARAESGHYDNNSDPNSTVVDEQTAPLYAAMGGVQLHSEVEDPAILCSLTEK